MSRPTAPLLRMALPKGSMQESVFALLAEAGLRVRLGHRAYRPTIGEPGFDAKILKPQSIVEMLHAGSRDVGFTGADWVVELDGELVELLDTGLDPVRLVLAAPRERAPGSRLPSETLLIATEYVAIARRWVDSRGRADRIVRSYGATEVFPPEDADAIIDNTATGGTLAANGLVVVEELMGSSTRLYANPRALDEPSRRARIESLVLLLRSVLDARRRVMLEVNVAADRLDALLAILPCMREATVASLARNGGFGVKAAVPRERLASLIPEIKACGGSDIVVSAVSQLVA